MSDHDTDAPICYSCSNFRRGHATTTTEALFAKPERASTSYSDIY